MKYSFLPRMISPMLHAFASFFLSFYEDTWRLARRHLEATSAHGGTVKCVRTRNRCCRFRYLCRTALETFPIGEQHPGLSRLVWSEPVGVWSWWCLSELRPSEWLLGSGRRSPHGPPGLAGPKHTPSWGGKEWIACSELASLSRNEGILFRFYMDSFVKTSFCVPIKYMNVQRTES